MLPRVRYALWSSLCGEYKNTHTLGAIFDVFLRVPWSNLELVPSCDEGPIWSTFSHLLTSFSLGEHLRKRSLLSDEASGITVSPISSLLAPMCVRFGKTCWNVLRPVPQTLCTASAQFIQVFETSCQHPASRCLLAYCCSLFLTHRHPVGTWSFSCKH